MSPRGSVNFKKSHENVRLHIWGADVEVLGSWAKKMALRTIRLEPLSLQFQS